MSRRYGRIGQTHCNDDSRALTATMKRNSEEAAFAMDFLFNDDEAGTMKRARNTGPRPGGRNMHGSVEYSADYWLFVYSLVPSLHCAAPSCCRAVVDRRLG